jgi:signal peptidase II
MTFPSGCLDLKALGTISFMKEDPSLTEQPESSPEAGGQPAPVGEKAILFLVMALVLLVDFLSKLYIENSMELNTSWAPIPELAVFFRITHVSNTGAAFGLFPSGSNLFILVAIGVSIFIVIYNFRLPADHVLYRVALGLQLGGAIGNLISRLRVGHVTDFLDFGPWPVFNFADFSIVAGVFLLAYLMLQEQRQDKQGQRIEPADIPTPEKNRSDSSEDHTMLWNE